MSRAPSLTPFKADGGMHAVALDNVSAVRARYRARAIELVEAEKLTRFSKMVFQIHPLERPAAADLWVKGEVLHAPRMLPEQGTLTGLAFGVYTLGVEFERRITLLFAERKASLAMALDGLANELLMDLSRRMQDRVLAAAKKRGLDVAGELRAGDPGLALEEQGKVLRLAGAESIHVGVTSGLLLNPLKSSSVVYGVGENLPAVTWSRCDDCRSRPRCRFVQRQQETPVGSFSA